MAAGIVKRMQGRPSRGVGDVGRERLVEAARAVLRQRMSAGLSRKAVADVAGVTPALVSYYFPDPGSLVAAATRPLIGERINELRSIIEDGTAWHERLGRIAAFLVGLNEVDATLVDRLSEACRTQTLDPMLCRAYEGLRGFYIEGGAAGAWRSLDPDFFLFALWGMCKAVAEAHRPGHDNTMGDRGIMVADLVLNGLRTA